MKRLDLNKNKIRKKSKKGQGISVTMLVIIVLALIVLAVLAFGFGMGWQNMWQSITAFFGGSNVSAVVQACSTACMTQSGYDYCVRERNVRFEGGETEDLTCNGLEDRNVGLDSCDAINCEDY